jgi:hypothetical protein
MRTRCSDPFQHRSQHPTEESGALKLMKLCWQRDVIEQQLHARRLGPDAREPLEDLLSAIKDQLRMIRNNPSS